MPVKLKNTFIFKQGKTVLKSTNIVLDAYRQKFCQGHNPTAFIAVGSGSGTVSPQRTAMFNFLAAKQSQSVKANYDVSAGRLFAVKKIIIPAEELAGSTITEVGFCCDQSGSVTTHSVLPKPIVKENAPLEVIAIIYASDHPCLIPGPNEYIKCLFGDKDIGSCQFEFVYMVYAGAKAARQISPSYRHPVRFLEQGADGIKYIIRLVTTTSLSDLVLYIDGNPSLVFRKSLRPTSVSLGTMNTDTYGRINLGSFRFKETTQLTGQSGRPLEHTIYYDVLNGVSDTVPQTIEIGKGYNIRVSKNGKHLYAYLGRVLKVYSTLSDRLYKVGEIIFPSNIALFDSSGSKFYVICRHYGDQAETRKLYWGQTLSDRAILREISGDIDQEPEAFCATSSGEDGYTVIHCSNNTTVREYILDESTGAIQINCNFAMPRCGYLGASYGRGTMLGVSVPTQSYNDIKQMSFTGGTSMNLGVAPRSFITGHAPDVYRFGGERIMALNTQTLQLRVYYQNGAMKTFQLAQNYNAKSATLCDEHVFVITNDGRAVLYSAVMPDTALSQVSEFALAEHDQIDAIYFMSNLYVAIGGGKARCYIPQTNYTSYIRSESFLYNRPYTMSGTEYVHPNTAYNSIIITLGK